MIDSESEVIRSARDDIASRKYDIAMSKLRPLENSGSAQAAFLIGCLYYRGQGVLRDMETAKVYFRKAASKGLAAAQSNAANILFHQGETREAYELYREAAEQGHVEALYGYYRVWSRVVKNVEDRERAMAFLESAAKSGHPFAQRDLLSLDIRGKRGAWKLVLGLLLFPYRIMAILVSLRQHSKRIYYDLGVSGTLKK